MGLLESIRGPRDLRRLDQEQLRALAEEIRRFLVTSVARTGGHLGPNLGTVELTLALHRVFDSPRDRIVWDTGHQAYVHKIVTGRAGEFDRLRKRGGLSGYPSRAESDHDVVENSHASTSLSYADGIAKAHQLRGLTDRHVVAVIGDGALTGGMAWEAINNIAADKTRRLVIVVNDNERSYAPTIGGLAHHLATLRTTRGYERFLEWGKQLLGRTPVVGGPIYGTLHGMKKGIKDIVAPQGMFEDLGLKYVGPVDGHDLEAVEHALRRARGFKGPVLVHCLTHKGQGYDHALSDLADNFHSVGVIDPETGQSLASSGEEWGQVFGAELLALGEERPDIVAITAAMLLPTRLGAFAERFPERVFDVGIAEQHAVTSAAGLAMGGMHPVVAIYATFLNRAFDQVLMDVALHKCGVTFVLDRAGITGDDGASHNGVWDLAALQIVPGLRLAAPRDGATLRQELREAVAVHDAPTVLRFPKGPVCADIPAVATVDGVDVLRAASDHDVLLVSVGAMAGTCLEVAERCARQGIGVTVVDPRWVKPLPDVLATMARDYRCVVTVEDGVRTGGVGSAVAQLLRDRRVATPLRDFAVPSRFLGHGKRSEVLAEIGLTAQDISRDIVETVSSLQGDLDDSSIREHG
ncbi:MAG: 1-deoxy-D-xylulose-5-phosphate synthase [Actinomycetota bacterium]|nr:1-deoxy-D-xylulose-5-phosphate synthase [Actinomycetota bacterium]